VFCVSSTEYQKIKNTTMDDGPPTVSQWEDRCVILSIYFRCSMIGALYISGVLW
jgi:hypothetical protein